jgi:hypothetical protein
MDLLEFRKKKWVRNTHHLPKFNVSLCAAFYADVDTRDYNDPELRQGHIYYR